VPSETRLWKHLSRVAGGCALLATALSLGACRAEEQPDPTPEPPPSASLDGMAVIPAGCFLMGSISPEGDAHELPQHSVALPEFAIDVLPVTNEQYAAFLAGHGNECPDQGYPYECADCSSPYFGIDCGTEGYPVFDACQDLPLPLGEELPEGGFTTSCNNHPVVEVSWFGAQAYCASLNKRLPSEAEWARAANGPGGEDCSLWRRFPWGTDCPPEFRWEFFSSEYLEVCAGESWTRETSKANCVETDCYDGFVATSPVGYFPAGNSVEGVADLEGNTSEWTLDTYHGSYGGAPDDGSAWIADGRGRVRRSTSFYLGGRTARSAYRVYDQPWSTWDFLGFRCAASESPY